MDGSMRTGCLENTRTDILTLIVDWASNPTSTQKTLWLHGPAGSGKSGFKFVATPGGAAATGWNYYTTATPLSNVTGTREYCAGDDGVLRVTTGFGGAAGSYAQCLAWTPSQN